MDQLERVCNFLLGRTNPDDDRPRHVAICRPGDVVTFDRGRQTFGSGDYRADHTIQGVAVETGSSDKSSDFVHCSAISYKLALFTTVRWFSGDTLGDGHVRRGLAVCLEDQAQKELEDHVIKTMLPTLNATQLADVKRFATPRLRLAARERLEVLLAIETAEARRKADAKERAVRMQRARKEAAALEAARRVSGDEQTARSVMHLFM